MQIFASETELLDYIEPIDILNEEYSIWDSSGQRLLLSVDPKGVGNGPIQESSLEAVLRRYAYYLYENKYIADELSDDLSIKQLIDIIQDFQNSQQKPMKRILRSVARSWQRFQGGIR